MGKDGNVGDPNNPASGKDGQGNEGNVATELSIDFGDGEVKKVTADEVKNMIEREAALTQKSQKIAAITDAAKKYNIDPLQFVEQAEMSFGTMTQLIDNGIINEKGELVAKPSEDHDKHKDLSSIIPSMTPKEEVVLSKVEEIVSKALDPINKRLDTVDRTQMGMIKENMEREIMTKHDNLTADDVTRLLSTAMKDSSKTVWEHAEEMAESKKGLMAELRAKHAKEFGVNLEEFDANKLHEQGAEGGGAAAVLGGKKISFKARSGDANAITPKQATIEFMKRQNAQ